MTQTEKTEVWNKKSYWKFQGVTALISMWKDMRTGSETPKTNWLSLCFNFEIRNTILRNCPQRIEEHRNDEWVLQVILTQPVTLDFLPENKHRKLEPEKLGERGMKKWFDFLNKLVCGLKIISAFNSVQAFRRKMNEMCEEEDKDKV